MFDPRVEYSPTPYLHNGGNRILRCLCENQLISRLTPKEFWPRVCRLAAAINLSVPTGDPPLGLCAPPTHWMLIHERRFLVSSLLWLVTGYLGVFIGKNLCYVWVNYSASSSGRTSLRVRSTEEQVSFRNLQLFLCTIAQVPSPTWPMDEGFKRVILIG